MAILLSRDFSHERGKKRDIVRYSLLIRENGVYWSCLIGLGIILIRIKSYKSTTAYFILVLTSNAARSLKELKVVGHPKVKYSRFT